MWNFAGFQPKNKICAIYTHKEKNVHLSSLTLSLKRHSSNMQILSANKVRAILHSDLKTYLRISTALHLPRLRETGFSIFI